MQKQTKKNMNRKNFILRMVLSTLLMLFTCLVNIQAKDHIVQRGMTKEQVMQILGKPDATSFDSYGDRWTYRKSPLLDPDDKFIYISFGRDGKVISYQECIVPSYRGNDAEVYHPVLPPVPQENYPDPYSECQPYALSENAFDFLYGKVKDANFDDDRYTLLEVATLGCWYTCDQCARMMTFFSFDDDKLKALQIMGKHVVDPQNAVIITNKLSFSDSKDKALRMLPR